MPKPMLDLLEHTDLDPKCASRNIKELSSLPLAKDLVEPLALSSLYITVPINWLHKLFVQVGCDYFDLVQTANVVFF